MVDTRKTTPGWRALEKYAVRVGGAGNHRMGLYDGVLIKDNHIAVCGGVAPAVARIRDRISHLMKIESEVATLEQVREALSEAGARVVACARWTADGSREVPRGRLRPAWLLGYASSRWTGVTLVRSSFRLRSLNSPP